MGIHFGHLSGLHYRLGLPIYKALNAHLARIGITFDRRGIANNAWRIADRRGLGAAKDYLRAHDYHEFHYIANLLEANFAKDDEDWTRHLNAYLQALGAPEITLNEKGENRFARIKFVQALAPVNEDLKVTVIMPAYNSKATIARSIASILNQSWRNLELLIVDDASTDDTVQEIRKAIVGDERARLFVNPINVGPYLSKNRALEMAIGDFVTGQDADDISFPDRITTSMSALGLGRAEAAMGYMLRMTPEGHFNRVGWRRNFSYDGISQKSSISVLFSRHLLSERLGGWDNVRAGADSELIERSKRLLGPSFVIDKKVYMLCLDHDDNLTNSATYGFQGLSSPRHQYRAEWEKWHRSLDIKRPGGFKLSSRVNVRPFAAPAKLALPSAEIRDYFAAIDAEVNQLPSKASLPPT